MEAEIMKWVWIIMLSFIGYFGLGLFLAYKPMHYDNESYEAGVVKLLFWPLVLPIYIFRWIIDFCTIIYDGFKDILSENN